jgi:hypothetical protein
MRFAALLSLLLALVACNDNNFAGEAVRGSQDAKKKSEPAPEGELGNEKKTDKADAATADVKDADDEGTVEVPVDADQGNNGTVGGDKNILDFLQGLLGSDSDIVANQPDENTIDFGDNNFFHVGDNGFQDTTCKVEISLAKLDGTQFYFEFEVKKDATDVSLEIKKVCGVDYGDSNKVRIINTSDAKPVVEDVVKIGDAPITLKGAGLKIGKYMVVVESTANATNNGDKDDFMIGQVKLKATKPVKAGKVGAK